MMEGSAAAPPVAPPTPVQSNNVQEAQWLANASAGGAASAADVEMEANKSAKLSLEEVTQLVESKSPDDMVSTSTKRRPPCLQNDTG